MAANEARQLDTDLPPDIDPASQASGPTAPNETSAVSSDPPVRDTVPQDTTHSHMLERSEADVLRPKGSEKHESSERTPNGHENGNNASSNLLKRISDSLTGLKQRFGESRVDLMAYGRTPWS